MIWFVISIVTCCWHWISFGFGFFAESLVELRISKSQNKPSWAWTEPRRRIRKKGEHCLSEASCAALEFDVSAQGTRNAMHRRKWFLILLPLQQRLRPFGCAIQQARLRGRISHLPVQPFPKQAIRIGRPEWFAMLPPMTVFTQKFADVFCSSYSGKFMGKSERSFDRGWNLFSFNMVPFIQEGQGESHA